MNYRTISRLALIGVLIFDFAIIGFSAYFDQGILDAVV